MVRQLGKIIRRLLRSIGYDIVYYRPADHALARRKWLLDRYGVKTVLDVGANSGQFAQILWEIGYRGEIVSFEPLPDAYAVLEANAAASGRAWQARKLALGERDSRSTIHVAGNSYSSSILPMLARHERAAPESRYVRDVEIEVTRLDAIFLPAWRAGGGVYLKIDTQGYEKQVLEGAAKSLPFIDTIQLEMSLSALYEGEMLFDAMYGLLTSKGYRLVAIEPGFSDSEDGELLQVDGIFHKFP